MFDFGLLRQPCLYGWDNCYNVSLPEMLNHCTTFNIQSDFVPLWAGLPVRLGQLRPQRHQRLRDQPEHQHRQLRLLRLPLRPGAGLLRGLLQCRLCHGAVNARSHLWQQLHRMLQCRLRSGAVNESLCHGSSFCGGFCGSGSCCAREI